MTSLFANVRNGVLRKSELKKKKKIFKRGFKREDIIEVRQNFGAKLHIHARTQIRLILRQSHCV